MKCIKLIVFIALTSLFFIQCSTRPDQKPTVYMVGDSTVKNGKGDGAGGLWGWGDFICQYLDTTKVNVENHALGGTSSRTYQALGLWDSVHRKLKKGDFVLIQFGHNDDGPINDTIRARGTIKGIGNESVEIDNLITGVHETVYSYGWYLRKIVEDTKRQGAIPIIMSPIPRNKWANGEVPKNDTTYGLWSRQIAEEEEEEEDITFVDLNARMADTLSALGKKNVTGTYFYERDHTHTNAQGAAMAAFLITEELQKTKNPINAFILKDPKIILPKKRSIFLVGDSTMANNGDENAVGWGVSFPAHVDTTRVIVQNKARGGRSSRTFRFEGLWDSVKSKLRPNDFVILQFGHNDAGNIDSEKYRGSLKGIGDDVQEVARANGELEEVHTYGWYMKKYMQETKEKGAIPIILSLTVRNEWPNGKVEQRYSTYVKWTKEIAALEEVVYLDISDSLAVAYEALGKEKVADFFPKDHTHTGEQGANFNAKIIAESLKQEKTSGIRDYIFVK